MALGSSSRPAPTPSASAAAPQASRLGAIPWIVLAIGAGLLLVSVADALGRTGTANASVPFWPGLTLIIFPAALRLCSSAPRSAERATIVVLVGLALYAIKVLRDPFAFTFGDELAHLHNLLQILDTKTLFGDNSILPITPRYPGVESAAAAIAALGGPSPFAAGLLLIGAARMMLVLGLYLAYERISGSSRVAGLAALTYAATPTFVYFSAQFSYESLALPLVGVVLLVLTRWMVASQRQERRGWAAVLLLVVATVVPTHHLTSYALVGLLVAVSVAEFVLGGDRGRVPWRLALGAAALTVSWLTLVAGRTVGYLSPVITDAVDQVIQTVKRESGTRTLFKSEGNAESTPIFERAVALLGIGTLAAGVLAGGRIVWLRRRREPLLVLLTLAAFGFLSTFPLRFVPAAWESASRVSGFLIVGVALVAALAAVALLERRPRRGGPLVAGLAVLVIGSGVIAGWPASLRQARPYEVSVAGTTLEPPSVAAARWARTVLGPRQRIAAQDADARLMLVAGDQTAIQGVSPDVRDILRSERLEPWMLPLLRSEQIPFVVTDRRTISADNIAGYFFDRGTPQRFPAATATKFDRAGADRVYDSGDIVVYDVRSAR